MTTELIIAIVNGGISLIALLLSIYLKRKSPKAAKTLEEISKESAEIGKNAAKKHFEKQCKKNKITLDTKSENNSNNNSTTTENMGNI